MQFNPFIIYGITNYESYQKYPFLESTSIKRLKNKMLSQIRDKFMFPERLLVLGEPGIGKTTALYYMHDLLKESEICSVFIFDKLIMDADDFEMITGENLTESTKQKCYFLFDFPDTINPTKYKKFLDYLWKLMHHQNQNNISFIFALNISHFSRSFSLSEILGKFDKFRLERMSKEESIELIKSRLKMANTSNYFSKKVYDIIFEYSKGIPRNIICASKTLIEEYFNEKVVNEKMAKKLLQEEYITQIIKDRIEDPSKRALYEKVVRILEEDFGGEVETQTDFVKKLTSKVGIGENKSIKIISDLSKFGIVNFSWGGKNNNKKIISLK